MYILHLALKNCPRLRIEVPPATFRTDTLTLTLTLTSDLDLQSRKSYGHDPYTHTQVKVKGHSVIKIRVETDRRTNGRKYGSDCITFLANQHRCITVVHETHTETKSRARSSRHTTLYTDLNVRFTPPTQRDETAKVSSLRC